MLIITANAQLNVQLIKYIILLIKNNNVQLNQLVRMLKFITRFHQMVNIVLVNVKVKKSQILQKMLNHVYLHVIKIVHSLMKANVQNHVQKIKNLLQEQIVIIVLNNANTIIMSQTNKLKYVQLQITVTMLTQINNKSSYSQLITHVLNYVLTRNSIIIMKHYHVLMIQHVIMLSTPLVLNYHITNNHQINVSKSVLTNGGSQMITMKNNVLKLKYVIHKHIMFTKITMNV